MILFGSVARGKDGPDSDIDLLVVFEHIDPAEKRPMMARIRSAMDDEVGADAAQRLWLESNAATAADRIRLQWSTA